MASGGTSEDGAIGFQIAPMVDVVFVLLLFFMSCAGQQIIEMELNISLPSGRNPSVSDTIPKTPIIIDILPDGKVQREGIRLADEQGASRVESMAQGHHREVRGQRSCDHSARSPDEA